MSFELLYTSAPKGLKSGSRGFCTVVCTQGMSAPLMTALESLSAYRHVYPPGDRNAARNPVAWSHLKMHAAGRSYHVLSRIADFGLDYSQRGNKLAHHLVFEADEETPGGPACLLAQSGNMETTWDGKPRLIPSGRRLRANTRPPTVCTAWEAMTGDAGWAGALAEAFLANPERQVYIVFKPGMELLPLMTEAIALLPAERRWDVTFSTYFTSLPPGVSCTWRCVLAGSPEADQGKKFGKALHIDLCQSNPPATGGPLVLAARSGRGAEPATHAPQFATAGSPGDESESEWELRLTDEDGPSNHAGSGVQFSERNPSASAGYGVARPTGMPPPPPPSLHSHRSRTLADLNAADAARRQLRIRQTSAGLALIVAVLGVAVFAIPQTREWVRQRVPFSGAPENALENVVEPGNAGRSNKNDDELDPTDADLAETRGRRGERSQEKERAGNESPDGTASSKSPTTAPNTDEKITANKTPPHDRPTPHPIEDNEDKVAAGQKKGPSPQKHPRFGNYDLTAVRDADDYSLFAISLENAVHDDSELTIPIRDAKSCTWQLHAPVGRSEIKFKQKGDETWVATVPNEEGVGSNSTDVLSVTRSYDHSGCSFRFDELAAGWERIKWCLLSVSFPNSKPRLFALQEPALKLGNRQFDGFSYSFQLAKKGDDESVPTIYVDSLEIGLTDVEEPLQFEHPTGARQDEFLACEIPPVLAARMLFAEVDRRLEMKLSQSDEKVTARMTVFGPGLNKIFDKGLDQRLEKLERQHANWSLEFALPARREKLKNELHADRPDKRIPTPTLNDVQDAVKSRVKEFQRERDKGSPEQQAARQAQIQELGRMLHDLEELETARSLYLAFKEGLKKAEIRQLRLHYNFELKADRALPRRLSIKLEYSKVSR